MGELAPPSGTEEQHEHGTATETETEDFGDVSIPVFMLDDTILGGQVDSDGVPLSAGEYSVDIMSDAQGNITGGMLKAVTWGSVNEEWHPTVGAADAW